MAEKVKGAVESGVKLSRLAEQRAAKCAEAHESSFGAGDGSVHDAMRWAWMRGYHSGRVDGRKIARAVLAKAGRAPSTPQAKP